MCMQSEEPTHPELGVEGVLSYAPPYGAKRDIVVDLTRVSKFVVFLMINKWC